MRAIVVSDLHYEFHRDGGGAMTRSLADADICLCAGDLADNRNLWAALLSLLGKFPHVVFICGNHEFYGSGFQAVRQSLDKLLHRLPRMRGAGEQLGELHVLDNSVIELEGRRFVGTTLWFPREDGIELKFGILNDFHAIKGATRRIFEENARAVEFLRETVREGDVVLTHHLPSPRSVHPRWSSSPYNCFYLCDIEDVIRERRPKLWIHGHTHDSCDYVVGTTQVVCNPFGYAEQEENPAFRPDLVLEI